MTALDRQLPDDPVPARASVGARLRRVPRPLALLLAITTIFGIAWTFVIPPWQAPDENAHYAYVQSLGERFKLPGDPARPLMSTEQALAADLSAADQTAAVLEGKPTWSDALVDRWDRQQEDFGHDERANGGGVNPASSNPPLYYLYAAGAYTVARGGDAFTRLYVERLAGILWMLVTVVATWLLAGELLGRDRLLQLLAAGVAALVPMVGFVSASVSPDTMLYAFWSLALWLGVRLVRRGATVHACVALFGVVSAAVLVKATSFALLPAAMLALAFAVRARARRGETRPALLAAAAGLAVLVVPFLIWSFIAANADRAASAQVATASTDFSPDRLRFFLSYLWQFYLPQLPGQETVGGGFGLWEYWVTGAFGRFGWLEVTLQDWAYGIAAAVAAVVTATGAVSLWRARRRLELPVVLFLAAAAVTLVLGLHWTDFGFQSTGGRFLQGRYLLPLIALAGVATAFAVGRLAPRVRPVVAGALLAGLVSAELLSLATNLVRFHA